MKKVIIIVVLLVIISCGGFIGGLYFLTKGPADAADRFVALLGEGKVQEAYDSAAMRLRQAQSVADFTAAVDKLGLRDAASTSWPNRSIKNDDGAVEGTITTKAGSVIPVIVQLVKENGEWRVLAIHPRQAQAGIVPEAKVKIPPEAELRQLATATLLDFDQALKLQDFTPFHDKIAKLWQAQITAPALQKTFQEFIDKKVDLADIRDVQPVFSAPPGLNADQHLVLRGYYLTQTQRVDFTLTYTFEHPDWKLFGIRANVSPLPNKEDEKPTDKE